MALETKKIITKYCFKIQDTLTITETKIITKIAYGNIERKMSRLFTINDFISLILLNGLDKINIGKQIERNIEHNLMRKIIKNCRHKITKHKLQYNSEHEIYFLNYLHTWPFLMSHYTNYPRPTINSFRITKNNSP